MKGAATVKDEKRKQQDEKNKIRRWILKSVSETTPQSAVTLYAIKKFLDSKQSGLSNNPETKLVMKRLTESGHLVKIDGKYADGKNGPKDKQPPAQKRKSGSESKKLAKGSVTDKQSPAQKRKSGSESKKLAKSSVIDKQAPAQKRKSESGSKNLAKDSVTDKQPPAQKRKSESESKNLVKGSITDKQPPAQKRKIGSESKNLAKGSATIAKRSPTEKAKPQDSGHVVKTVGKNSPKDKQPPAQKRKKGSELKSLTEGRATPLAERSSSNEAVPKESETVN